MPGAFSAFGEDAFGRRAESAARFFGTPQYILGQTVIVVIWIVGNVIVLFNFDPFPFILLNLAFSTQAAYAAPLILLAGNRQALRDRMTLEHTASEADKEDRQNQRLLEGNKALEVSNQEILKRVEALEQRILQLEKSIIERLDQRLGESRPGAGCRRRSAQPRGAETEHPRARRRAARRSRARLPPRPRRRMPAVLRSQVAPSPNPTPDSMTGR